MPPVEWYYARDDKQQGPVSAGELKQLASRGEVRPDDLVWREGMDDWVEARNVKGLFEVNPLRLATQRPSREGGSPAQLSSTTAASGTSSEAPTSKSPPESISQSPSEPLAPPVVAQPSLAQPSAESSTEKADLGQSQISDTVVEPIRSVAATFGETVPATDQPQVQAQRHPLDRLLDAARRHFATGFVQPTTRIFTTAGHWGLYLAMLAYFVLAVMISNREDTPETLATGIQHGLVISLLLFALQFAANRMWQGLNRLGQAVRGKIATRAMTDCTALLAIVAGIAALLARTFTAVETGDYWLILTAIAAFILYEYFGFVALNPKTLGVELDPMATAQQEATGVFTFLLAACLRMVPVTFGVGIVWGLIHLIGTFYGLFTDVPSGLLSMEMTFALIVIILSAGLPLLAYLLGLLVYLAISLSRAVLVLPEKLDAAATDDVVDSEAHPLR